MQMVMKYVDGVDGKRSRRVMHKKRWRQNIHRRALYVAVVETNDVVEEGRRWRIREQNIRSRTMKSDLHSVYFHNPVKMSEYDQLNSTASQVLYDISIVFNIYRATEEQLGRGNHATCVDMTKSQEQAKYGSTTLDNEAGVFRCIR